MILGRVMLRYSRASVSLVVVLTFFGVGLVGYLNFLSLRTITTRFLYMVKNYSIFFRTSLALKALIAICMSTSNET